MKANSQNEAIVKLFEGGIYVIWIIELLLPTKIISSDIKKKHLVLSEFFEQLHFLICSGITITEALSIMEGADGYVGKCSRVILANITKGISVTEAMKQAEDYFPALAVEIMAHAEKSGRIETTCKKLSEYYHGIYSIKREIKSALAYPILVLFFCAFSVGFIFMFVMPSLSDLLYASNVEIDGASSVIFEVSGFIRDKLHMVLAIIAGFTFVAACFYYDITKKRKFWRLISHVPHIRKIRRNAISSMLAGLLSMSIDSGIPVYSVIEMAGNAIECSEYRKSMLKMKESIAAGESMSIAIASTDLFPTEFATMAKIGEASGDLSGIMHKIACYFENQVESSVKKAVSLIGPLLIVGVTAIIGMISYIVMTPMLKIANGII